MEKRRLVEWLEVTTGLAVLVGLGLVVTEIRVNTAAVNRQAAVERASALTEPFFYSEVVRSADRKVRAVDGYEGVAKVFAEHYEMSQEEARAWTRHLMQLWGIVQADYLHSESDEALELARLLLLSPDNRLYVENWHFFVEEFQIEIDRIIANIDSTN